MNLWVRNSLFLALCLSASGMVAGRFLERPKFAEPKSFSPATFQTDDFRQIVGKVDRAFAGHWESAGVSPTPAASDLAIARRLSLALTGTIPSLEEVRAFEKQPAAQRAQWWLSHLFEDQR